MKKVKNMVKKITALLIVAAMMIGSCMSVMAETHEVHSNTKGTITINNVKTNDIVTLIPLVNITYDEEGTNTINYTFASDAVANLARQAGIASIDAYKALNSSSPGFVSFMKAVQNNLATLKTTNDRQMTVAENSTTLEFTEMPMGQYYVWIQSASGKIYSPITVELIPRTNTDISGTITSITLDDDQADMSKFTEPTINKEILVEDKVAAIGSEVHYTVKISVPKYPDNFTDIVMKLTDNLGAGLVFKENSLAIVADGTLTLTEGRETGDYAVNAYANTREMQIDFIYDKVKNFTNLTISYTAIVTSDIVVGGANKNTATYTYTVDTDGRKNSKTDEETTTTYALRIQKKDGELQTRLLEGVEFELLDSKGQVMHFDEVAIKSTELGDKQGSGYDTRKYVVNPAGTVTTLVTDEKGFIAIVGLDTGTYTLRETKAKQGYKPIDPIQIEITSANVTVKGVRSVEVLNYRESYELPSTGGDGIWFFIGGGIVLMGAAVVMLVAAKKKGKRNVA